MTAVAADAALYECTITHARTAPLRNVFTYRSYQWLVDLDPLPMPGPGLRLLAVGPAIASVAGGMLVIVTAGIASMAIYLAFALLVHPAAHAAGSGARSSASSASIRPCASTMPVRGECSAASHASCGSSWARAV